MLHRAARLGDLVTIGLTPTRPETGYGYIERTTEIRVSGPDGTAYKSARFVEKPDLATATEYLQSGRFLWNASMFIWRVDSLTSEMTRLLPEIQAGVTEIAHAWNGRNRERVHAQVWSRMPTATIDNGVMEHADRVAVVPAEMGWSDVGDWHGLGELIEQDDAGNAIRGDLVQIDTTNSVVWSDSRRMVATIGINNVVIVDTEDALLVVDRERCQDVRLVVDELKALAKSRLI